MLEKILENIDKIAATLASLTVIIGSIWVAFSFKYKHNADVRNLYLKNFEKVWEVAREFYGPRRTTPNILNKITSAFVEAQIYLPKNIIDFIEDIRIKLVEVMTLEEELQEKFEYNNNANKIRDDINNKMKNVKNLYRKHIIDDPWTQLCDFFKGSSLIFAIILGLGIILLP